MLPALRRSALPNMVVMLATALATVLVATGKALLSVATAGT